jgi:hypothetical protein
LLIFLLSTLGIGRGQVASQGDIYSHRYTLGVFAEGSPTSSHILMGIARQRILIGAGGSFAYRLHRWRGVQVDYLAEVRPLLMESDPVLMRFQNLQYGPVIYTPPIPLVNPNNLADAFNVGVQPYVLGGYRNAEMSRRWTYSGGASPFGIQINGWKHSRIQPEFMASGGFLLSPRDIPVEKSSSFNFVMQFGGGIEWYQTGTRSWLLECRFHHFSNHNLGAYNPGVDSALWKLSYRFGKS